MASALQGGGVCKANSRLSAHLSIHPGLTTSLKLVHLGGCQVSIAHNSFSVSPFLSVQLARFGISRPFHDVHTLTQRLKYGKRVRWISKVSRSSVLKGWQKSR